MKSDGEASIVALKMSIKAYLEIKGKLEEAPVGEHQSNSLVELAVKSTRKQVVTMRDALETKLGAKIDDDHPIMQWLLRWATQVINRFRVNKYGRTAYETMRRKR